VRFRHQVHEDEGFTAMSVRARRLLLSSLIGAFLLYIFFKGMDWRAVGQAFSRADPRYMAGVVLVTVIVYAVRAWRWGYLLSPLARVPFTRLFSTTLLGFAAGLVVPRAGEVLRPYLVARHHSLRTSAAFATIILERLVDLITVLVLFFLYLYVLPMPAAQRHGPAMGVVKAGGALAGLAALIVLALLIALHVWAGRAQAILDRVLSRMPPRLAGPMSRAFYNFAEGLAVLQAPGRHLLAIAGQSALLWCAICLGIHWTNLAFGLALPYHTSFLIVGFLTVGVAVPTPGMVGGFHVAYLQALVQAFGVDHATAGAAGIACHALSNLPVLLLGLVFLWREGLTFGSVARIAEEGRERERQPHLIAGARG
jgi:uncharacterized protein (TIRG00374 family)